MLRPAIEICGIRLRLSHCHLRVTPQRLQLDPVARPRPGGRGAATGGANVDDAFRRSIRNFVFVIVRCHRHGFLRADCAAFPSRRRRAFAERLDGLTAECPKKIAHNMNDPCGARCRDLARVLKLRSALVCRDASTFFFCLILNHSRPLQHLFAPRGSLYLLLKQPYLYQHQAVA